MYLENRLQPAKLIVFCWLFLDNYTEHFQNIDMVPWLKYLQWMVNGSCGARGTRAMWLVAVGASSGTVSVSDRTLGVSRVKGTMKNR